MMKAKSWCLFWGKMATCQQAVFIFGFTFPNDHKSKEPQLLACVELCYPQLFTFKVTVTEKKEEEQVNHLGHTL